MAYFIWLQFFPISWTNQSPEKDNNLHTSMHRECIRIHISCRTHSFCFSTAWKGMTGDSVLLNLLLCVLLCLCLLPYCLKTEVFLTAGLFTHKAVWFHLAGTYSHPRADLLVRYTGDCSVKQQVLLADFPRKRWILCSGTPSTCWGTIISRAGGAGPVSPDTPWGHGLNTDL